MIGRIIYIVAIITTLLVASCSNDPLPFEKEVSEDYLLSLSLQTDDVVNTRAVTEPGVDELHENVIEKVELFFYNGETLIWQVPKSAFTMTDGVNTTQKILIIRVPNDITTLLNGQNVTLMAIANGPESPLIANKTLTQLKQVVFTSNDMNISRQYGFLMEGNKRTGNIVFDAATPYSLGLLKLQRVAGKMRLKINKLAVPEYEVGIPTAQLVNYLDKTNLLSTDKVVEAPPKSTEYVDLVEVTSGGSTFFTTTIPYYSYENDWSADGGRETFILLEIPFTKDEITKRYFYRIPINYRLGEGGSEVRRNHLYEISISITELGATSGEMPFEVISSVEVKPWERVDIIQAELLTANYLVVKDKYLVMADVAETKVEYLSNSKVSVLGPIKAKFTSYDTSGTPKDEELKGNMLPKVTFIVENNKKYIKVVSPVPTNYVPLEIEFLVINEGGLTEEIRITQFPQRYITAKQFKDANKTFYKGTEDGPGATHKNFNLFRVTTAIGDLPPTSSVGSIIGDPTGPDGKTLNTDEANNIISPQFIIASQNGVTLQRLYNVDASGAESAVTRCSKYFEDIYGPSTPPDKNGRNGVERLGGNWRLPTRAEVAYIQQLQKDPLSAVKSLMAGSQYWSARSYYWYNYTNGSWNTNPNNSSNVAHIRCVYDIYKYE